MAEEKETEGKKAPKEGQAIAGILHGVGKILGIEGILEKAEGHRLIKERLDKIDAEIKRRLAESPLSARGPAPRVSMPPGIRGRSEKRQAEFEADIFDEGDYVMAVFLLPGVDVSTIETRLGGGRLILSFVKGGRRYTREFTLPLAAQGELTRNYRNGTLEVKIRKKSP
jgi:HSP20 family molecular chaperone IbpA